MSRYAQAKSIFVQALDLPPGEREAFVGRAAAGDEQLAREVAELLAFHDESRGGDELLAVPEETPERVGPWTIERELGHGGIGVVYVARRDAGPPVALKLLRGGLLSPELLARFRREAAVLARLDHPGIARAHETGVADGPRGPRPWLAMELVDGTDLRTWAAGDRTPAQKLELMARVCDAVQHAHDHGVVHRDLKPENILVRPDGSPVVLDFGVARLVDSDVRATTLHTTVGVLVGTIRYMSPEQADARPEGIGPRSDVHQLAALTYELVTGRLPFDVPEHSVHRALVAVLTAPPRPMEELPARLRRPLERVLRTALAKDPARRLASAALLAADLRRVAAGRAPLARPANAGGLDWVRFVAGAAALAALGAYAVGAVGEPPSPLDRAAGTLQPRRMFRRVMTDADSAIVRLHYNTRTLPRLREARAYCERALALLETLSRQPWYLQVRSYLRFRLGEAQYLIAERTYDTDLYAAAATTWYSAREAKPFGPATGLPDSVGIAASHASGTLGATPWGAAAMAWDDRGRLAEPHQSFSRALAIRREAVVLLIPGASPDSLPPPHEAASGDERMVRAGWLQGLGASCSNTGFAKGDPGLVKQGLPLLRRAAGERAVWGEASGYASILHDLGTAYLRYAALAGDGPALDSAFTRLGEARRLRADLPGYTSVVQSSREFALALRLLAWRTPGEPRRRAQLERALAVLDEPADANVQLGAPDLALLALTRAGVLFDLGCTKRDTALFAAAERALADVERALSRERAPVFAVEGDLLRLRIETQRLALTGAASHRERIRQLNDRINMNEGGRCERVLGLRASAADSLRSRPLRAWALDYPVPRPF